MNKHALNTDFRSRRYKLPKNAFAIAPRREPQPNDVIDRPTWSSITTLPDDVSWRTTDFHGTTFRRAHDLWGYWVSLLLDLQSLADQPAEDALCTAVMLMADEMQASTYAALTGFYRQAIANLRFGLEAIMAGAYFRAFADPVKMKAWADGHDGGQLWMKAIRNALAKAPPYAQFESGKGLETLLSSGGWINFLYSRLSAFSHGRPFFVDRRHNQTRPPQK